MRWADQSPFPSGLPEGIGGQLDDFGKAIPANVAGLPMDAAFLASLAGQGVFGPQNMGRTLDMYEAMPGTSDWFQEAMGGETDTAGYLAGSFMAPGPGELMGLAKILSSIDPAMAMSLFAKAPKGLRGSFEDVQARKREQGFDTEVFHGTPNDFDEIDPYKVDLGLHVGTREQANKRLQMVTDSNDEGNIMPLSVRLGNSLRTEDVGHWNNANEVAYALKKNPEFGHDPEFRELFDEVYDAYNQTYFDDVGNELSFPETPENREFLDDIRDYLKSKGYDSITYHNKVENAYGHIPGMTWEAQREADDIFQQIHDLETRRSATHKELSTLAFNEWDGRGGFTPLDILSKVPSADILEPELTKEVDRLIARERWLKEQKESPDSYIIFDTDADVRSRNADFWPEGDDEVIFGTPRSP